MYFPGAAAGSTTSSMLEELLHTRPTRPKASGGPLSPLRWTTLSNSTNTDRSAEELVSWLSHEGQHTPWLLALAEPSRVELS